MRKGKQPTFWRSIQPGQSMFYKWPDSKKGRAALVKSLLYYQRKINSLDITVMPDGALVRYKAPYLNI